MTHRERFHAILNYEPYDRMLLLHFGFWQETIEKWKAEKHISSDEASDVWDNSINENAISKRLGFDFNYHSMSHGGSRLFPAFEEKVIKQFPDGSQHKMNSDGVIELVKPGIVSISAEIEHTLTDRESWEKVYKPKLQFTPDRIDWDGLTSIDPNRETPIGLFCGSLYGGIRNWMGLEGLSYIAVDDEELLDEIIEAVAALNIDIVQAVLETGVEFDMAHFWEDICFNYGPLISPAVFYEKLGPYYKKITSICKAYDINIISVDCDGLIDALIPTWFENGVNTMFPIEVGTWGANIAPWRKKYGKSLLGVGGMDKRVFSMDYTAIDKEIERLKPLIQLGGYIPCPDHRIAPDAIWENVQYYCDKMRELL